MSIQELCGLTAQEITNKIIEQNGSNAFQISQASNNAYNSAIASYNATLAANKSVTNNIAEASEAAFTSSVTASTIASVTSTLILNTIVSNTSLILLEKKLNIDTFIKKTFNYYWDKYPDLFGRIQIVYTDVDENGNIITDSLKIIENNINYLNEYYNKGYRLFIGFSFSSILAGVLPWFETIGVKAKGICLNATTSYLDIPKPIYRLLCTDIKLLDLLDFKLVTASKIYYLYSDKQLVSESVLNSLEKLYPGKIIPYPVNSDSSNLKLSNIKELYKNVDDNSITFLKLFINNQLSNFLNIFNDNYQLPTITYDTTRNGKPNINELSKNAVLNKFNYVDNISFSTSKLFRDGLDSLKGEYYTNVPNSLLLINKLAVNGNIDTLPSHNSILEFNENNDVKYNTILNTIYSKDDKGEYYYKEDFYSVYDPIVGKQLFYVNN